MEFKVKLLAHESNQFTNWEWLTYEQIMERIEKFVLHSQCFTYIDSKEYRKIAE